ncbi:hypothetical protein KR093_005915 [Drosophila rubida]|uniref:Uncharacterized protein n=1 Tax=Drosophila rubida TaxID=30044 RepID=A0AAD4K0E5_9MUSC|nr:hypothetical protein KR093_005915 [Drosophila rubida]
MLFSSGLSRYNRDFFSNFTLRILKGIIDIDATMIKALHAGIRSHLTFEYRSAKSKGFQRVFQIDLDYCSVMKATRNSLSNRWFDKMWKSGNNSRKCPILPAYYYTHGWKADGDMVPPFLTMGDYRITGTLYYGKYREQDNNPILRCIVNANLVGK